MSPTALHHMVISLGRRHTNLRSHLGGNALEGDSSFPLELRWQRLVTVYEIVRRAVGQVPPCAGSLRIGERDDWHPILADPEMDIPPRMMPGVDANVKLGPRGLQ
jgi:hypothetical protein